MRAAVRRGVDRSGTSGTVARRTSSGRPGGRRCKHAIDRRCGRGGIVCPSSASSTRRPVLDVARRQPALDARGVHFHHQGDTGVHRHRKRLRAAHAAETGGDDEAPGQRSAKMTASELGERLVGALQDALRADVDPAPGRLCRTS